MGPPRGVFPHLAEDFVPPSTILGSTTTRAGLDARAQPRLQIVHALLSLKQGQLDWRFDVR